MGNGRLNFFGLIVERKTDILALAAFLISITTIGMQIGRFFIGPELVGIVPTYISIYENNRFSHKPVNVVAQVPVINNGAKDYSEVVTRIFATIELGASRSVLEVNSIAEESVNAIKGASSIAYEGAADDVSFITPGITVKNAGEFVPLLLRSGEATGQKYLFSGTVVQCQISNSCPKLLSNTPFAKFLKAAEQLSSYKFEFHFTDSRQEILTVTCTGRFSSDHKDILSQYRRIDLSCDRPAEIFGKTKADRRGRRK